MSDTHETALIPATIVMSVRVRSLYDTMIMSIQVFSKHWCELMLACEIAIVSMHRYTVLLCVLDGSFHIVCR